MKEQQKRRKNIKESLKLTTLGFTLVELLAVIVILAIILVIAVPKVMSVIEDSKKATLESTAKMIASQAEKQKVQNTVLGNEENITCKNITNINDVDYASCSVKFDNNIAKVTIVGSSKFEGLYVCNGTKTNATATKDGCTPKVNAVSFADDDWSTIVTAVQSGNHPYEVGNTKTVDMGGLGIHTIRVANITKCNEEWIADVTKSQTACGFVLEFEDIITRREMNGDSVNYEGNTNVGGWPASEMRAYLNDLDATSDEDGVIYNALPEELRNGIINTYVVSSHGLDDEGTIGENKNFVSIDKLYLLSTEEVWAQGSDNTIDYDTSRGTSRQLDYYANNNVSTSNYGVAIKQNAGSNSWWWLRSSIYDDNIEFYRVLKLGNWSSDRANYDNGVSPAFRLAN